MKDLNYLRESFFDKAQEALVIFDKELNFIDVNETLLVSLKLNREQIIGKNLIEISPRIKETERYKLYLEVIHTGEPVVINEVRIDPGLGNYVSMINVFKLGEGLGLSAINITDLKEAVDELETFVYKLSHDMRAPIANILGLISIAKTEIKDIKATKSYLSIIKNQVERLDTILQKLFETTRIQHRNKTIHLINFNQLIDSILHLFFNAKGFNEIRIEKDISVKQKFYNDKSLLTSLLQNLLENAIKYRKENISNAFIKITIVDENGGVKIAISDNGIGISDNLQKNVYKMFFRATNQASGSGLGLYTVNHPIKRLGGNITLDSKEKDGTTFTVYLPNNKS